MGEASTDTAPGRRAGTALARLVFLLDQAVRIPRTRVRVGLDPILGLVPGGGDAVAALLSTVVILVAARRGLPRPILARMVFNVGLDLVVGAIPLIGDLFDVAWKANSRNLRLLERYAGSERRPGWRDWLWVWGLLGVLVLMAVGVALLVILALRAAGIGIA